MSKLHFPMRKALLLAVALSCSVSLAQTLSSGSADVSKALWQSDSVVYLAGRAEVKQNARGSLRIESHDLIFSTQGVQALIPLSQMTSVSIGDERVATGGAPAKVARRIPVFGFGAVMGAVTSKTVDVLTVEYQNSTSGHHGAVFELPNRQAEMALKQLSPFVGLHPEASVSGCDEAARPMTLLVAPIDVTALYLPAEYRVLLYEQLVAQLRKSYTAGTVLRVGNRAASCPSKTLQVSVTAFKKGNERLRSSTGPLGLFVGGTSVAASVRLLSGDGSVLFEKSVKSNKHGDSDSLNVTRDVARGVVKRLAKAKPSSFGETAS